MIIDAVESLSFLDYNKLTYLDFSIIDGIGFWGYTIFTVEYFFFLVALRGPWFEACQTKLILYLLWNMLPTS